MNTNRAPGRLARQAPAGTVGGEDRLLGFPRRHPYHRNALSGIHAPLDGVRAGWRDDHLAQPTAPVIASG